MATPDDGLPLDASQGSLAGDLAHILMEFELAPMPMFLLLPDGRLLKANLAVRELFAWEGDDYVGVNVRDLADPEHRAVVVDRLQSVLGSEGATPELATVITGTDGRRHRVRTSSLTVRDESGVPRYIVARVIPAG